MSHCEVLRRLHASSKRARAHGSLANFAEDIHITEVNISCRIPIASQGVVNTCQLAVPALRVVGRPCQLATGYNGQPVEDAMCMQARLSPEESLYSFPTALPPPAIVTSMRPTLRCPWCVLYVECPHSAHAIYVS